jgi:hypothetical protein
MDSLPPVQSRLPVAVERTFQQKRVERPCQRCPVPVRTVKRVARVSYVPEIIRTVDEL